MTVYMGSYGFITRQRAKVHNGMIWDGIGGSHKKHGVFFLFSLALWVGRMRPTLIS
jgi:hypothetical protein